MKNKSLKYLPNFVIIHYYWLCIDKDFEEWTRHAACRNGNKLTSLTVRIGHFEGKNQNSICDEKLLMKSWVYWCCGLKIWLILCTACNTDAIYAKLVMISVVLLLGRYYWWTTSYMFVLFPALLLALWQKPYNARKTSSGLLKSNNYMWSGLCLLFWTPECIYFSLVHVVMIIASCWGDMVSVRGNILTRWWPGLLLEYKYVQISLKKRPWRCGNLFPMAIYAPC